VTLLGRWGGQGRARRGRGSGVRVMGRGVEDGHGFPRNSICRHIVRTLCPDPRKPHHHPDFSYAAREQLMLVLVVPLPRLRLWAPGHTADPPAPRSTVSLCCCAGCTLTSVPLSLWCWPVPSMKFLQVFLGSPTKIPGGDPGWRLGAGHSAAFPSPTVRMGK